MSQSDALSKLKQLKQLLEEDLITEEEFQEKKKMIIDRMTARPSQVAPSGARERESEKPKRSPRQTATQKPPNRPQARKQEEELVSASSSVKECAPDECWRCLERLHGKVVTSNEKNYHIDCFTCHSCKLPLVGQAFFPQGTEVVCEKHVESDDGVCAKCCENIVSDYVIGDGEKYHEGCFVCAYAGCALDGGWGKGMDGEPYCYMHLQMMSSQRCEECLKTITSDLVRFADKSYHGRCFVCSFCQNPLGGKGGGKFYNFDDKPFCFTCHSNLHYDKRDADSWSTGNA